MWFSPDGRKLAFLKFNDSLVQNVAIPFYRKQIKNPYPVQQVLNYPKVSFFLILQQKSY